MKNIAIFASGTGTNAKKIVAHFAGNEEVRVALIISNRAQAPVLQMAKEAGIDTFVLDRAAFYGSEKTLDLLRRYRIDFLVLAGFLWLVPSYLVRAFDRRIVNIHPALLPKYGGKGMYGMHVHQAVKEAGDRESGITIHYVNEHYDEGDIIFQARCPVEPADTPQDIAGKVQQLEHRHFPAVIEQLIAGIEK